jgi:hypothetical protein
MSERPTESHPDERSSEPSEAAKQRQEDFYASSPELQDEIRERDETEFWDTYEIAHEMTREESLAGVRARLHRLEQEGIEVTPEMEERELKHAQDSFERTIRPRSKNGKFAEGTVEHFKKADPGIMDAAVREKENLDEYEKASPRTAAKIDRAWSREEVDIRELAEELRREDAVTNVDNHIIRTAEQGARWWPWQKTLARRRALRELKNAELTDDWLAYAEEQYRHQQRTYQQNGESSSETVRAFSDSGDRIKATWQKGGFFRKVFTVPFRLGAEAFHLGRHGVKRGRKEVRARSGASKS